MVYSKLQNSLRRDSSIQRHTDLNFFALSSQKKAKEPENIDGLHPIDPDQPDQTSAGSRSPKRRGGEDLKNVLYEPEVFVVQPAEYQRAAKTLKIAFGKDEFVKYLTSPMQSNLLLKEQVDEAFFEATVYLAILDGVVVAIRDEEGEKTDPECPFLAVACFYKPESEPMSLTNYFYKMWKSGYLKFAWLANQECRRRVFQEQWPLLNQAKSKVLGFREKNSWYLSDIGTTPQAQGKGCARKMLSYMYDNYIDPQSSFLYLESSHPRNRKIYERLGFTYIETIAVCNMVCDCLDECEVHEPKPLTMDLMVRGVRGGCWYDGEISE
ncbi:unnamed protein product [Kuraishia capsulata CBS 1993]|uniref:N-acetyltransferase domain-containing protein n=1 Tax=Kuraishia capsulata CBS 1993 TaxID=1382522 RepID=W6MS25_9ASCO|nr:uncharacterized protein KUCA_T00005191001 [Kuraishia capsulata CBS 1993]CDK29203.1 unnamed protein product [Kuraishia capsulata CBS 1993]